MEELTTIENKNWTSKKELAEICNCSADTLERIIADLTNRSSAVAQNHMKKGGYHNSMVFYDDDLVKAIQLKMKQNAMNAGGQRTENSIIKQSNMEDMEVGLAANAVMKSGSIEAARQFANLLISRTEAVAQRNLLQAENNQLRIENKQLQQEVMDAYDKGYEEGRYKLNYMYRYDSLY